MDFVGLFLDKGAGKPLYQQLYSYLAEQISGGQLAAGERLPGKRTAAAGLGVSVNTVDEAYQMLAAEGYVTAKPRSGFVVAQLSQQVPRPGAAALPSQPVTDEPAPAWRYNLSSGGIDAGLFPRKLWARLSREVLAEDEGLFLQGEPFGDEALRNAITTYVRGYRGVKCEAGQVVVGAGLEVLTSMLVRLFPTRGVAVESPGYPKTAHILRNEGVPVLPVPVDRHGMQPGPLRQSGAGVAYLTPSHQFPTGGVMPVGRRTELLGWAAATGSTIIEDDYDSEFRFDGRPLPSLQGLDEAGSVVYAGTFSRSLAPGLRAAYLVLPQRLLPGWRQMYGEYACTVGRPDQHTLSRLMAGGHFSRSLNRARGAYRARRDALLAALAAALPHNAATVLEAHTGLYFLLELHRADATAVAEAARQRGIRLRATAEYRQPGVPVAGETHWNSLIIGYGGLRDEQVEVVATALAGLLG